MMITMSAKGATKPNISEALPEAGVNNIFSFGGLEPPCGHFVPRLRRDYSQRGRESNGGKLDADATLHYIRIHPGPVSNMTSQRKSAPHWAHPDLNRP